MKRCYVCDKEIQKGNTYDEHIILNALGGRLHSKDIICSVCNAQYPDLDTELTVQLNSFANLINIHRDRGHPLDLKGTRLDSGEAYFRKSDGTLEMMRPLIKKTENQLLIKAKNRKELKKVLHGIKRKYPSINVEECLKKAESGQEDIDFDTAVKVNLNKDNCFRSICKTALNFYIYSGGDAQYIKHLIPYLKRQKELAVVVAADQLYCTSQELNSNEISHTLYIHADAKNRLLYAYVELFSTFSFVILLNENFAGAGFSKTYCYDLIQREYIHKNIHIDLDLEAIRARFSNTAVCVDSARLERFSIIAEGEIRLQRIMNTALRNVSKNYPKGFDDEMERISAIINEYSKLFLPHLTGTTNIPDFNFNLKNCEQIKIIKESAEWSEINPYP